MMTGFVRAGWLALSLLCGLQTVTAWAKELPPLHETELRGGMTLSAGNSDTLALNLGAATTHKTGPNEFSASGEYNYGQSTVSDGTGRKRNETTTQNAKAQTQYNRLLWPRTYEYVKASGLEDDIASIDYRVIAGPGMGHYLIKAETTALKAEAGIAYLSERVAEEDQSDALLRLEQRFEHTLQEGAKLWQSVEYLPTFGDFGAFLVNSEIGTESTLTRALKLRVVLQDRYDSQPAASTELNDLSLIAGVVYRM